MSEENELIEQYRILHERSPGYGRAATYLTRILKLIGEGGYESAIDYGCGKGLLADRLIATGIDCIKYDPAIPAFSSHPDSPVDIVICNDVMEHLTYTSLKSVIDDIKFLAIKCIFFNISCRPAVHKLPDGRNCHTLIQSHEWWLGFMDSVFLGWKIEHEFFEKNQNLILILKK